MKIGVFSPFFNIAFWVETCGFFNDYGLSASENTTCPSQPLLCFINALGPQKQLVQAQQKNRILRWWILDESLNSNKIHARESPTPHQRNIRQYQQNLSPNGPCFRSHKQIGTCVIIRPVPIFVFRFSFFLIHIRPRTIMPAQQPELQLFTGGFNLLNMQKPWKIPQNELVETTHKAVERKMNQVPDDFHEVLVCTHAKDPHKNKALTGHWGENIHILRNFIDSHAFKLILKQLKRREEEWSRHVQKLVLCTLCRQGRHRSVAAAWCLKELYGSLGFRCLDTVHTCRQEWRVCTTCADCISSGAAQQRQDLRRDIRQLWDDLR